MSLRLAAMIEALHRGAPDLTTDLFGDEWIVIWGMRNRIAHGYAWIDIETVRVTVGQDIPSVEGALRDLHARLMSDDEDTTPDSSAAR